MKKLSISVAVMLITSIMAWGLNVEQDLVAAVAKQKQAADSARWEGLIGIGLDIGGYVLYSIGITGVVSATTSAQASQGAGYLTAGGFMILGGSITSFIGWLAQLDANDRQAEVNAAMLKQVKG